MCNRNNGMGFFDKNNKIRISSKCIEGKNFHGKRLQLCSIAFRGEVNINYYHGCILINGSSQS